MPFRFPCSFCVLCALIAVTPSLASAQTTTTPAAARIDATIYSISLEWDIVGDSNHNAAATVSYRPQGTAPWFAALPLVRVDLNGINALAGSVLFLTPGTTYDVQLSLSDPDGGSGQRALSVSTRPLPTLAASGRTLHVVPANTN